MYRNVHYLHHKSYVSAAAPFASSFEEAQSSGCTEPGPLERARNASCRASHLLHAGRECLPRGRAPPDDIPVLQHAGNAGAGARPPRLPWDGCEPRRCVSPVHSSCSHRYHLFQVGPSITGCITPSSSATTARARWCPWTTSWEHTERSDVPVRAFGQGADPSPLRVLSANGKPVSTLTCVYLIVRGWAQSRVALPIYRTR